MQIIDLSVPVDESTKVQSEDTGYSDPVVAFEPWVEFQHKGYRVTKIEMGAHAGTHCDLPYHFVENGKKTSDYLVENWIGWAVVMDFVGQGPISLEMLLPYKSRIVGRRDVIPVLRNDYGDYLTDSARKEFLSWKPKAVVMGEGTNIDVRLADSTEFLRADVPMIMNPNHQAVTQVQDGDLLVAALLMFIGLEAAPMRLLAVRGLSPSSREEFQAPAQDTASYERRIEDLERLVGRLSVELEALKASNRTEG